MKIRTRSTPDFKKISQAFVGLKNEKEVFALLRDICTLSEMSAMTERLEVAEQVEKWVSYRIIAKNTGASTATITRVAHWFHHGMGGYHDALARIHT